MKRRDFLIAAASTQAAAQLAAQSSAPAEQSRLKVCFFSKHLPQLGYSELGKTLKDAGFDGVDLTVRPGGHVLPEKAAVDLPRAADAIRSQGIDIPMITTEMTSAVDPLARTILSTAARLSIPLFKLGYWKYSDDPEQSLRKAVAEVGQIASLARECGITAGFHNHPRNVGLCGWDGKQVLQGLDPKWIGYYFDANNATEEGGVMGWEVLLRLALPRLKMAAFKDFYWEKVSGKWVGTPCPLGQGMVNWPKVFALLRSSRFAGPVSIHQEYKPSDRMVAARADMEFVRKNLQPS